jgi:hypothetical protein
VKAANRLPRSSSGVATFLAFAGQISPLPGWFSDYVVGMDWQQTVSLIIVVRPAGALLWSRLGPQVQLRTRHALRVRHAIEAGIPSSSGALGEPPRVVVKMK